MWRVTARCAFTVGRPAALCTKSGSSQWSGVHFARSFSARVTDASRQPGGAPAARPRSLNETTQDPSVPVVTDEQRVAIEAKREAEKKLIAARHAANEAATVVRALRKVADDAAAAKAQADQDVVDAKRRVDEASGAIQKSHTTAKNVIESAVQQEKMFLSNAFDYFDTEKKGCLVPDQIRVVLETLKLPAEAGDVEELVEALDMAKDGVIWKREWVKHMSVEMKTVLRTSSHASKWQ